MNPCKLCGGFFICNVYLVSEASGKHAFFVSEEGRVLFDVEKPLNNVFGHKTYHAKRKTQK